MKDRVISIRIEESLLEFLKQYSKDNYTTMSKLIIDYIIKLKVDNENKGYSK